MMEDGNVLVLVSVIVPNYNHAQYLDERIRSILNQSYQNYEIIILDDCSTDNSKNVIEKYRHDCHVSHVVYNEENSGSTFIQWQKGFDLARGELIWIAESDDSCAPTFLERLVEEFKMHQNLVLAFSTSIIIDEFGNFGDIIQSYKIQRNILSDGMLFVNKYLYWDNVIYNASSALFKKNVITKISRDYVTYKASGDWLFWISICEQGSVSMVNEGLNYFRKHGANITERAKCNGVQQIENKKIFDYLSGKKWINHFALVKKKLFSCYQFTYYFEFESPAIKREVEQLWSFPQYYYVITYLWHLVLRCKNFIFSCG